MALSDRPGQASLYVPTQEHGLLESSSSLEASFKPAHSEVRSVELDTLDALLAREAGGRRVSLIKADVEGHEASVLAGARETVRTHRPILFVEVLDRADVGFLSSVIAEHGYLDLPLRPDGVRAQAAITYDPAAWNHVFIPNEDLDRFLSLAPGG